MCENIIEEVLSEAILLNYLRHLLIPIFAKIPKQPQNAAHIFEMTLVIFKLLELIEFPLISHLLIVSGIWKIDVLETYKCDRIDSFAFDHKFREYFLLSADEQLLPDFMLVVSDADIPGVNCHLRKDINKFPLDVQFLSIDDEFDEFSPLPDKMLLLVSLIISKQTQIIDSFLQQCPNCIRVQR